MGRREGCFKPCAEVDRAVADDDVLKKYINEHGGDVAARKRVNIRVNLRKAFAGDELIHAEKRKAGGNRDGSKSEIVGDSVPLKVHAEKIVHGFIYRAKPDGRTLRADGAHVDKLNGENQRAEKHKRDSRPDEFTF